MQIGTRVFSDNETSHLGWVERACAVPVAFAQVREDAEIDLRVARMLGGNLKGVMVASGGCTACALTASELFESIELVDMNPAQLSLTKLKLELLEHCNPVGRHPLLGHADVRPEARLAVIQRMFNGDLNPVDLARHGIDDFGRYEFVFQALRNQLAADHLTIFELDDVAEQRARLRDQEFHSALKQAFEQVMSQENLTALFGEKATANSVRPFHEHFFLQTLKALETMPAKSNPWMSQMFLGRFQSAAYPWIDMSTPSAMPQITFHNKAFSEHLESAEANSYDFVHLSNILDWLDEDEARQLLCHAHRVLKLGGMMIIRQLNSSLDMRGLVPEIDWQSNLSEELLASDRSFFYANIHVGAK